MVTLRDFNVSTLGNTASCQTVGSSSKCAILKRTTFIKLAHRMLGIYHSKMQIAIAATRRERHRYNTFPCEYASEQGAAGADFRTTARCAIHVGRQIILDSDTQNWTAIIGVRLVGR